MSRQKRREEVPCWTEAVSGREWDRDIAPRARGRLRDLTGQISSHQYPCVARAAQKKQLFSPPKASLFHKRMYFRDLFPWRSNLTLFFKVALQDKSVIRSNSPSWVTADCTGREMRRSTRCHTGGQSRNPGGSAPGELAQRTDSGNTCTPAPGL